MVGRKEREPVAIRAPAVSIRAASGMIRPTKARDSAKEVKKQPTPQDSDEDVQGDKKIVHESTCTISPGSLPCVAYADRNIPVNRPQSKPKGKNQSEHI